MRNRFTPQQFFFSEDNRIAEKYEGLFSEADPDEQAAGVADLSIFGFYATLHTIAHGDILRMDDVARKTVGEIFVFLLYEKHLNEYKKRLTKVLQNKK